MPEEKISLEEIRKDLDKRMATITDLKNRLQNLWEEIGELLGEIDEIEGKATSRKRRGRKKSVALADAISGSPEETGGPDAEGADAAETEAVRYDALPERLFSDDVFPPQAVKPKRKPAPVKREGPSIVDVAEAILRETGSAFSPAELARMVEEKGVSSGNTQQVLLLAAGRKTRLVKNAQGLLTLPGTASVLAEPAMPPTDGQA